MFRIILFASLVSLCGCVSLTGNGVAGLSDAQFAAAFKCPETQILLDRDQAMRDYTRFIDARHPNWTVDQRLNYRITLLKAKNCTRSLAEVQGANSEAAYSTAPQ